MVRKCTERSVFVTQVTRSSPGTQGGGRQESATTLLHSIPCRPCLSPTVADAGDDGTTSDEQFDALSAAREGSDWYRNEGFGHVAPEIVATCDHYTVPQPQILVSFLDTHRPAPGR
ncbi:hypothetical protein Csp1_24740 [Corynebacterium provencense]|uniref:Uncharacterized protein n=1 Tax=Corynebacterium provencense TaxID=1737425 RepID=A0A2Z3YQL0_9CORY|nr:hypothetical protein Csp1_24740 [Corynebacterium provencense]